VELRQFCAQAGLRWVHCFCDVGRHQVASARKDGFSLVRLYVAAASEFDGDPASQSVSLAAGQPAPALRALLSVIAQRTVYGLVVPSIFHLATDRNAAIMLMQHIERLGTKVMAVPASQQDRPPTITAENSVLLDALVKPNGSPPNGRRNGDRP
jgi:hypothetical protein